MSVITLVTGRPFAFELGNFGAESVTMLLRCERA
jgi:hypothetical protein